MADEAFVARAAQLALDDAREALISAQRNWEDANRYQDETGGATALASYIEAKAKYDALAGTNKPANNDGQLSAATRNYLSQRVAGGDTLDERRWKDYLLAHKRAVNADLTPDTPEYFAAVSHYVDTMGDGRQPPLTEAEAAKISGISEQEYSYHAQRLKAMKRAGTYE